MLKLRKNKKGFTLVELIVVIAIMAVLAGTVAGVTVSQLNKQTDNTNKTQAKKIADSIYAELLENNDIDKTGMQNAIKEAYGNDYQTFADVVGTPEKGKIAIYYTAGTAATGTTPKGDDTYTIKYTGKSSGTSGNVTYTVTLTEGVKSAS